MDSNPPPEVFTGSVSSEHSPSFFVPFEEPPSQIARIIGIIAMIMGGLSILGGIMNIFTGQVLGILSTPEMDLQVVPTWFYVVSGAIGIGGGIGFLYGGYRMQKFEMIGQWITLGTLLFVTVLQVLLTLFMDTLEMRAGWGHEELVGGRFPAKFGPLPKMKVLML